MIQIRYAPYRAGRSGPPYYESGHPEWEEFNLELHVNIHAAPAGLHGAARSLADTHKYSFIDKCRADEFIEWLKTFDSWTEDYCPIRVRHKP